MASSKPQLPVKFHPNQGLSFPKCTFGKAVRSFREERCQSFPWLHYNTGKNAAFWHLCLTADHNGKSNTKSSFCLQGCCTQVIRSHSSGTSSIPAWEALGKPNPRLGVCSSSARVAPSQADSVELFGGLYAANTLQCQMAGIS